MRRRAQLKLTLSPRWRSFIGSASIVLVFASALVISSASPAAAQNPCQPSHCYANGSWNGGAGPYGIGVFTGGAARVRINSNSVNNWQGGFITVGTLWFRFAPNVVPPGPQQYWVEAGAITGLMCCTYPSGGGSASPATRWYWADFRPNGTGFTHIIGPAGGGTWGDVSIVWQNNNSYAIGLNQTIVGYSTNVPCCSDLMYVGSETYNTTGTLALSNMDNLWYRSLGGASYTPWDATYSGSFGSFYFGPYTSGVWFPTPGQNFVYGY